jgi:hypothetical protein
MKIKPSIRPTETYTETNFLRLHTVPAVEDEPLSRSSLRLATIEHLAHGLPGETGRWLCQTIVDGEEMTRDDALVIARGYATEHDIPVIYECHSD